MKILVNKFLIVLLFLEVPVLTHGQNWILQDSINLRKAAQSSSIDQNGNLFYSVDSELFKYNYPADSTIIYSPAIFGNISTVDARNTNKIFIFYSDFQRFSLIDRFLSNPVDYNLGDFDIISASAAGYDPRNIIWIFDDINLSLKSYMINNRAVNSEIQLNQILTKLNDPEVNIIKVYHNRVYLNETSTGILVFDLFGNLLTQINDPGLSDFHFFKNRLYFIKHGEIVFYDTQTGQKQADSIPEDYLDCIIHDNLYYFFNDHQIKIYNKR